MGRLAAVLLLAAGGLTRRARPGVMHRHDVFGRCEQPNNAVLPHVQTKTGKRKRRVNEERSHRSLAGAARCGGARDVGSGEVRGGSDTGAGRRVHERLARLPRAADRARLASSARSRSRGSGSGCRSTTRRAGRGSRSCPATRAQGARRAHARAAVRLRTGRSWRSSARPRARPYGVSGNLFEKADLAARSPGRRPQIDLTKGHPFTTFFRVVSERRDPGPADRGVRVASNLKAKNVVIIDSQDDYSIPLASAISRGLRAGTSTVSRESVSADDTDFSSIVANVGSERQRRRLRHAGGIGGEHALEPAPRAGQEGDRLRNGRRIFAVAVQAEERVRLGLRSGSALRPQRARRSFASTTGTRRTGRSVRFGPATYMAGFVAMTAITKACADGQATRAEVATLDSPHEHSVDLRRHGSASRGRAIRCRRGSHLQDHERELQPGRLGTTVLTRTSGPFDGRAARRGSPSMR